MRFIASDTAERSTFDAIFQALDRASRDVIGPATPRLLVIKLLDDSHAVTGGLWAVSVFRWLHLQMLFVPQALRRQGIGSALLAAAETEARSRDCLGIYVDALSFQAVPFYEKTGFSAFGVLDDCPPDTAGCSCTSVSFRPARHDRSGKTGPRPQAGDPGRRRGSEAGLFRDPAHRPTALRCADGACGAGV
jgi:GNAT superfamily N-acetyltransferase